MAPTNTSIVAHRGGAALFPENSRHAFRFAARLGVDAIEIDVHQSADEVVLVHHDGRLERTTTGTGRVGDATSASLQGVTLVGTAAESVPQLVEVLSLFSPADAPRLSLEIKTDDEHRPYAGLEERVVRQLWAADLSRRVFVHSFCWDALDRVRALAPEVELGANVDDETVLRHGSMVAVIDEVARRGYDQVNVDHALFDEAALAAARRAGLRVTLWTVNDASELARWIAAGVDAIATDRPDLALVLREQHEQQLELETLYDGATQEGATHEGATHDGATHDGASVVSVVA